MCLLALFVHWYLFLTNCGPISLKRDLYIVKCRAMPFSPILLQGKIDATGLTSETAQKMYGHMADAPANLQTAEWNKLLQKSRTSEMGNVIEAERLQLMTRDICMSTISLFIMTLAALVVLEIFSANKWDPIKMFIIPLVYLLVMFFTSRAAARSRAKRFVAIVIKNDVQKRHLRFRHHSFGKQSSNINCFSADGSAKAVLNGLQIRRKLVLS